MSNSTPVLPEWQRWTFSVASRGGLMAVAWWALTGGDTTYLWLSAILVAAATASTFLAVRPGYRRWHLLALVRFTAFFAYQSLLGGVDVARRAFDPRMPIDPGIVDYHLGLESELARVITADTASLLPGTVGVELSGGTMTMHVLDRRLPVEEAMKRLERRVADVLGETITAKEQRDYPET